MSAVFLVPYFLVDSYNPLELSVILTAGPSNDLSCKLKSTFPPSLSSSKCLFLPIFP